MLLKVVVVGAGLAGLGAAISLNRAGHQAQVIEQSGFHNEVGAAIHVTPNASRILKEWRCALIWTPIALFAFFPSLTVLRADSMAQVTKELQEAMDIHEDWLLTHRVDLHNTLRGAAAKEVNGRRVDIRLSSRVASVDAEAGLVTLEDGTKFTGDLAIGADGIHSRSMSSVTGEEQRKESTGQNCFRFLIPVSKMQASPLTRSLLEKTGLDGLHAFTASDRRLAIYPCRQGKLLNVAGIHPAGPDTEAKESSWLDSSNVDHLLEVYKDFGPELQEMCRLGEDVKLWSLVSRQSPATFVKGKLALDGDAAHPTLPRQGGAQAFEDGAALGALFMSGTTPAQVSERLEMHNRVRYGRSLTVMTVSKAHDERRAEMLDELRAYVPDGVLLKSMLSYTWGSYPARDAHRLLVETGRNAKVASL